MAEPLHLQNWTWRVDESPQRRIRFGPNVGIVLQELGFLCVWWLGAFGLFGITHTLSDMRENLRVTEVELEQQKRGYDHQLAVERSARGPEATERLRRQLYGHLETRAAQQAALIRQREEKQAIWHQLFAGAGGLLACWGLLTPLSLLWRRTTIRRDGDELIFNYRRMLGPLREARVGVVSLERPQVEIKEIRYRTRYGRASAGYLVILTLSDGPRTVVLLPTRTRKRIYDNVEALLREMRSL